MTSTTAGGLTGPTLTNAGTRTPSVSPPTTDVTDAFLNKLPPCHNNDQATVPSTLVSDFCLSVKFEKRLVFQLYLANMGAATTDPMILRRLLEPANFSNLGYGVYTSIQNIVQGKTDDNEDPFPVLEAFVDFLLNLPLENQAQCVRYKWNKAISSAHKKALAADKKELVRKIEALMGVWSNLAPPPPVSTPSPDSTKGRSPSPSTSETPSGMSVDENSSEKASGTKRASSPTEGAEEAARKKQDVKEKPVLALSKEPPVRKPVKPRTPSTFPRATAVPDANFLSNLNKNAAGASSKGTFTIRPRAQSSKPAAAPSVPEAKDTPMTPPKSASTSPINTSASAKPKKSVRFKPDHAMVEVRLYHRDPEEWGIPVVFRTPPAVQLPADVVERSRFLTEEAGRRFQYDACHPAVTYHSLDQIPDSPAEPVEVPDPNLNPFMIPLEDVHEAEEEQAVTEQQYHEEPAPAATAAAAQSGANTADVNLDMLSSLLNNGQLLQLLTSTQLNGPVPAQSNPVSSSYPANAGVPPVQTVTPAPTPAQGQTSPAPYNYAESYSSEDSYPGNTPHFSGAKYHRPHHNPNFNRNRVNKKVPRPKRPHPRPQGDPSTIPCYFYEKGNCARKNCPFLHC